MNVPTAMDIPSFRRDPTLSIARAAVAAARARRGSENAIEHAAKTWPFDPDAQLVLRAATAPTDLTNAAALVQIAAAVVPMLTPHSAAAQLFDACLSVPVSREAGIFTVPGLSTAPGVAFVADGAAKPVVQSVSSDARIELKKIAGIAVATAELLAQASTETVVRTMLAESAGAVLDSVVFSNQAGTVAQPAGLLYGITPLTPDAGTGAKSDAMAADLIALGSAIAPVAGSGRIAIIANWAQVLSFLLRLSQSMPNVLVFSSAAVPVGTVIAIATNGIVSAMGVPTFEVSSQSTLSMNNTAVAWPGGPVHSMWQTDAAAIKMVLGVDWARRSNTAVAWMSGVNW